MMNEHNTKIQEVYQENIILKKENKRLKQELTELKTILNELRITAL